MNELPEEIELPPITQHAMGQSARGDYAWALTEREDQLKAALSFHKEREEVISDLRKSLREALAGWSYETRRAFEAEAANREQKAEIERLKAELNRYPADWWQDSSLKTWFPFTAEELDRLKAELASLRASVGEKWKPIESAPKDQSVFLGRKGNIIYMTQSCKCYVKWPHQEGGPTFRDEWNMIEYDAVSPWSPTHWAEIEPLPVAPALPGEEK